MEEIIREKLTEILNINANTIPIDANLIEFGLHSIAVMQMSELLSQSVTQQIKYADLANSPTINSWIDVLKQGKIPDVNNVMVLEDIVRLQLKLFLQMADSDVVGGDDNLIEFGLHSILVMQLSEVISQQVGNQLPYAEMLSKPTINAWVKLLVNSSNNKKNITLPYLNKQILLELLSEQLDIVISDLLYTDNLLEYGLNSLMVMHVAGFITRKYQKRVTYASLMQSPTIQDWLSIIENGEKLTEKEIIFTQNIENIKNKMQEQYELSEMQFAYWVGRQTKENLGGVSAHLYMELDGRNLNLQKFYHAVEKLYNLHSMLRVKISKQAYQSICPSEQIKKPELDDMRHCTVKEADAFLSVKRIKKTNQRMDIENGHVLDINITLLPNNEHRLHFDADMVAIDPQSFKIILEDLARLYLNQDLENLKVDYNFFQYLEQYRQDVHITNVMEQDKIWWTKRISQIPSIPIFSDLTQTNPSNQSIKSNRLAIILKQEEKNILQEIAKSNHFTLPVLLLTLFSEVIGMWTMKSKFRLSVPLFYRQPYHDKVKNIVGDFTNFVILNVEIKNKESLLESCQRMRCELNEVISHSTYSGVKILRDLSKLHGKTEMAPIVFTSGLNQGELFTDNVLNCFGNPSWIISQAPQVNLDVQVAEMSSGILINWDVRMKAFSEDAVKEMFNKYIAFIRNLSTNPETINHLVNKETSFNNQLLKSSDQDLVQNLKYNFKKQKNKNNNDNIVHENIDSLERVIRYIFRKVFESQYISVYDDFFQKGGNEVLANQVVSIINQYFPNVNLTIEDLSIYKTAVDLSQLIKTKMPGRAIQIADIFIKVKRIADD